MRIKNTYPIETEHLVPKKYPVSVRCCCYHCLCCWRGFCIWTNRYCEACCRVMAPNFGFKPKSSQWPFKALYILVTAIFSTLTSYNHPPTQQHTRHTLKYKIHEGREFCLFCSFLVLQHPLFLACSRCSVNACWVNDRAPVQISWPWWSFSWLSSHGCFLFCIPVLLNTFFNYNIYHIVFLWKTYLKFFSLTRWYNSEAHFYLIEWNLKLHRFDWLQKS